MQILDQRFAHQISELRRQLDNLILFGVIYQVEGMRARVHINGDENRPSAPLRWLTSRAAESADWWAPDIGEQVMLLSPQGNPAQAIILPALYSNENPPPSLDPMSKVLQLPDGALFSYDFENSQLSIQLPEGGTTSIESPGGISLIGDTNLEGSLTVSDTIDANGEIHSNADVTANVSLNGHTHGGVSSGGSTTQGPQ